MKQVFDNLVSLYPMPLVLLGTKYEDRINWMIAGHVGIIDMQHIMVSLSKRHYTNDLLKKSKKVSVSLVKPEMLKNADYTGCVSGWNFDKASVFKYEAGDYEVPIPQDATITMECNLEDIYTSGDFECFILNVIKTYADTSCIVHNKLSLSRVKPVLFEMPGYNYINCGEIISNCNFNSKGE